MNTGSHFDLDDALDQEISGAVAAGSASVETVDSLIADEVVFIEPSTSVADAARTMESADVGLAVVGTADHVVGVVSERDIVRAVAHGLDLDTTVVEVIETDDLRWATADAPVDHVADEMMRNHLRHLLVRAPDGRLHGVVSMRDVLGIYLT